MKKLFAVGAILLILAGCSDKNGATKALDDQGFTEIVTTGRPGFLFWFSGCGENDFYATGFTAKNARGKTVQGVVCSGFWFKGNTVRTF